MGTAVAIAPARARRRRLVAQGAAAPRVAELAQSRAVLSILQDRPKRADQPATDPVEPGRRNLEDFEFLSAASDHLDDRARIVEEFRRGVRSRMRSSKV